MFVNQEEYIRRIDSSNAPQYFQKYDKVLLMLNFGDAWGREYAFRFGFSSIVIYLFLLIFTTTASPLFNTIIFCSVVIGGVSFLIERFLCKYKWGPYSIRNFTRCLWLLTIMTLIQFVLHAFYND